MVKPLDRMPADLNRRVQSFGKAAARSADRSTMLAAEDAKRVQERAIRRDSGGDMRLSGVNRAKGRPGNVRVGATVRMSNRGTRQVVAEVKATGPLQFIANDTAGRVIRSAYVRGRFRRGGKGKSQFIGPTFAGQFKGDRRAVLNIPGIGYRRSARHPGTKGKDTWDRVVPEARRSVRYRLGRETDQVMIQTHRTGR